MELRRYWQILMRFWWVLLIFSAAGAFNAYTTYKSTTANYQAVFQANIQRDLPPANQENKGFQDYFDYYRFISTEYVVDDFTMVAKGSEYLKDVETSLKNSSYPLNVEELKGIFDVERKHRELIFTVRGETQDKALALSKALSTTLSQNAGKYLAVGDERIYTAKIIDMPTQAVYNSGRNLLLALVRLVIGVALGFGLAFLLAYLDNRLHTTDDFKEVLGLPVLGEIPGKTFFGKFSKGSSKEPGPPDVSKVSR